MKRFEAIDSEINTLEILKEMNVFSKEDKQLLSELKQITDEHSEMVEMLSEQNKLLKSQLSIKDLWLPKEPLNAEFSTEYIALCSMFNALEEQSENLEQLLTKINDK